MLVTCMIKLSAISSLMLKVSRDRRDQPTGKCRQVVYKLSTTERITMPGQIRPNKKMMKTAYKILGTPKDMQQRNDDRPSEKRVYSWRIDSSIAPRYN